MRLFQCSHCAAPVYFDNMTCLRCEYALGYAYESGLMAAFAVDEAGEWRAPDAAKPTGKPEPCRPCANRAVLSCNWMLDTDDSGDLCQSCRLTSVYPDQSVEENVLAWQTCELSKRRWLYAIRTLGLPVAPKTDAFPDGITFRFMQSVGTKTQVMTGHADGVITINAAESDPVARLSAREAMEEPYRTLLGHFRHESGHYYWQRLIERDDQVLANYRAVFGDERQDYGEALKQHYEQGAPADWAVHFVSQYAASHPWEDFAETWAHYLHIVDAVEVAESWKVSIDGYPRNEIDQFTAPIAANEGFKSLMARWLPLSLLANSLNRSLGHDDAYPFAPSATVLNKLGWVHGFVTGQAGAYAP